MQGLKRMRTAAGLSLRELGSRLGVSAQAVHKWETGVAWPSAYLLPQIAEALDCSIADLYMDGPQAAEDEILRCAQDDKGKIPDDTNNYTEEDQI